MFEIKEIHAAGKGGALNEEWFIVENVGETPFSTAGCAVCVGKGSSRLRTLGTIDPGFVLAPGEKTRIVTGNPGKKAHGKPPEDKIKNYHLFSGDLLISGPGQVIALTLRQIEVARAEYDPKAKHGVAASK